MISPLAQLHSRAGNLIQLFTHDLPKDQSDIDQVAEEVAPYVANQAHLSPDDQRRVQEILFDLTQARVWYEANARPLGGRAQIARAPAEPGILDKIMNCIKRAFEWLKTFISSILSCRRNTPQSQRRQQVQPELIRAEAGAIRVAVAPPDYAAIIGALPDRAGNQAVGTFLGTVNQYGAGRGVGINEGTAACAFCALNMLRRLWRTLEANKAFDNAPQTQRFIDTVVQEGVQIRSQFKPDEVGIDDHVSVVDAWEGAFPNEFRFFARLDEAGSMVVGAEGNGRRTYREEINRFHRWATGEDNPQHMIGATFLKGPETHVILVDMRNRLHPRYYHSDSHGQGGGPAYIHVFDHPDRFAAHLAAVAPYVANAGDEINRLQIMPYTVAPIRG